LDSKHSRALVAAFLAGFGTGGFLFSFAAYWDVRDAWVARDVANARAKSAEVSYRTLKRAVEMDTADCQRMIYKLHNPDPDEFQAHRWEGLPPEVKQRLRAEWARQQQARSSSVE